MLPHEGRNIAFDEVEVVREVRAILAHLMKDWLRVERPEWGGESAVFSVVEEFAEQGCFGPAKRQRRPRMKVAELVMRPVVDEQRSVGRLVCEKGPSPLCRSSFGSDSMLKGMLSW
jgi:hypothetical protein